MGLFGSDSFLSSFYGGTSASKISNPAQASMTGSFQDIWGALIKYPALLQGFQMSAALGQDPWAYLNQFSTNAPYGPNVIQLGIPGSPASGGKIDLGKLTQANAALSDQYESKQLEYYQDFVNKLSNVPAFSDLAAKASGKNLLTEGMSKAFEGLAGAALGSGASSGFLTDPTKQMTLLGPVALEKANLEYQIQQDAQNKLWGLSGAGGLMGASQANTLGLGVSPYANGILGAAGLFGAPNLQSLMNAQSLNTQLGQSMSQFNSAFLPPILGGGGGDSGALGAGFLAFG